MKPKIVAATAFLVEDTEKWLDAEEAAYKEEKSKDLDTHQRTKGFRCNWDMVKKNWEQGNSKLFILEKDGRSIGFLFGRDILEVRPDERRNGYGRLLAEFMLKEAYKEGLSVLKIEIAPSSAMPFWSKLGFTIDKESKQFNESLFAHIILGQKISH